MLTRHKSLNSAYVGFEPRDIDLCPAIRVNSCMNCVLGLGHTSSYVVIRLHFGQ